MVENGYNKDDVPDDSTMSASGEGNDGGNDNGNDNVRKRRAIGDVFRAIFDANGGPVDPIKLRTLKADYFRDACEYLGEDILPRDLLEKTLLGFLKMRNNTIKRDDKVICKLKDRFKTGAKCFLFVRPTTDTGHDLSEGTMLYHGYFGSACICEDGTTELFSYRNGPYAVAYPAEIKDRCAFDVEWESGDDGQSDSVMAPLEFIRFYNSYVDAFNNWRTFFELEPFATAELHIKTEEEFWQKCGFSTPPPSQPPQSE